MKPSAVKATRPDPDVSGPPEGDLVGAALSVHARGSTGDPPHTPALGVRAHSSTVDPPHTPAIGVHARGSTVDPPRAPARSVQHARGWTVFDEHDPAPVSLRPAAARRRPALRWTTISNVVVTTGALMGVVYFTAFAPPPPTALEIEPRAEPERLFASSARPLAAAPSVITASDSIASAATAVTPRAAPRTPPGLEAQVRRLASALRGCTDAPTGAVLLELDRGLRSVDLVELDPGDPWHACAARLLARVDGKGRVEVKL